ncbi:hypothetical protein ACJMK2_038304 [Sinanodonta woodiana]|uniref:Methyltransferase FkbM domain-containing protein n=1 Tax=Sinanodonta woodiana TaxID=1069815 RepID=A0ABD3W8L0_SINWO
MELQNIYKWFSSKLPRIFIMLIVVGLGICSVYIFVIYRVESAITLNLLGKSDKESKFNLSLVPSLGFQSNSSLDYVPDAKWNEYMGLNVTGKLNLLVREKASMKDPRLIDLIRKYYIEPPAEKPYALKNSITLDYSCGQSSYIDRFLNSKDNGFFVEAGTWLGEYASKSLFFEKSRGWSGLLIEPNPENFLQLKKLNRKAFHIRACLSTHPFPVLLKLNSASDMSRIIERREDEEWVQEHNFENKPYYEVPCFPLYSIMLAMNRSSIDYFGLDVEGNELLVLQTIPFNDLDIKSLSAECLNRNDSGRENAVAVRTYLESRGFICNGVIGPSRTHGCFAEDLVFLKKDLASKELKCELVKSPFSFWDNKM